MAQRQLERGEKMKKKIAIVGLDFVNNKVHMHEPLEYTTTTIETTPLKEGVLYADLGIGMKQVVKLVLEDGTTIDCSDKEVK